MFSITGVVFPDPALLTIPNLLSSNYTKNYLLRRLIINGTDYTSKVFSNFFLITDLRLIPGDQGIDGLTNSFAAGLWAIEMSMEFAILGGTTISFFNSLKDGSFQSGTGSPPSFKQSSLIVALYFMSAFVQNYPDIYLPTVVPSGSSSILIYYLDYITTKGFIALNKDLNPSASGYIRVKLPDAQGVTCLYYSASDLSSSSATINGLRFEANNSDPVGEFIYYQYSVEVDGYYNIALNYSQAVACRSIQQGAQSVFPRNYRSSFESTLLMSLVIALLLIFI